MCENLIHSQHARCFAPALSSPQNKFHRCELVESTAPALQHASIHIAVKVFPHRTVETIKKYLSRKASM